MVGRLAVLASIILLSGCASLTPEEEVLRAENAEWKRGIDLENYNTCDYHGGIYVHEGHKHSYNQRQPVHWSDIRNDLWANNCRSTLGSAWISY